MSDTPKDTQIDNIRLAVLRVMQEIGSQRTGNVRSIEIYKHPLLTLEEGKRISNALFQMKRADPALLLTDVSGNYELTAAGLLHLDRHKDVPLDRAPVKPKRPEGMGSRVNDPAVARPLGREPLERKPLATRPTQLPPIPAVARHASVAEFKPGGVRYVPGEDHVTKTIAELQTLAQRHEEQAAKLRETIENLRQALLDKSPEGP